MTIPAQAGPAQPGTAPDLDPDLDQDIDPDLAPDLAIDVTAEVCPMTFVRTRLALDRLRPGQVLGVTLRGDEAARNVPGTARLQGHAVLETARLADGTVRLLIRKTPAA